MGKTPVIRRKDCYRLWRLIKGLMKSMAVEEGLVQLRAKRGWASVSLPLPAFLPTVSWALGTSNNLISAVICIWKWIRIWVRWKALLGWACGTAQGHRNKCVWNSCAGGWAENTERFIDSGVLLAQGLFHLSLHSCILLCHGARPGFSLAGLCCICYLEIKLCKLV